MRPSRILVAAVLALFTFFAVGGCAVAPQWAYFDVDRHPTGAYPAQAGYYAGAYVVYPVALILQGILSVLGGRGHPPLSQPDELDRGAGFFGVVTGCALGAPFHLICLCVHEREAGADEAGGGDDPGTSWTLDDAPRR